MTKCPHCQKAITRFNIERLEGFVDGRSQLWCTSYNCPQCHAVLSVQIDPLAIQADTIKKLKSYPPVQ